MTWAQQYDPLGNLIASALVAAIPVVVLLGLLGILQVRAYVAALCGLASAILIAIGVFHMPVVLAAAAAGYGAAYGLFPIGWIVLNAIFIYDITVKTGKFEIVKHGIAALASDRRIQALLIAFSFGAFIEGAAGFGTPVAISAALLVGLGFRPLQAAGLALLGNTAPVAYGALGTPLIALAKVTDLDLGLLSAMVGRQLPVFSLIVPFWLVVVMAGWRGMLEVWPACLVAGGSFAVSQFLVSNFHGPWLVDVISAVVSMASLVILLRFWQPRNVWRFEHERGEGIDRFQPSHRDTVVAWMPWVLLCALVFAWGLPSVKKELDRVGTISFEVTQLHKSVVRVPPVVPTEKREEAVFSLNSLSATGTALLAAAILAGLLLRLSPVALARIYWQTFLPRVHEPRHDCRHAGARLHHEVQRPRCDDGFGLRTNGAVVSVFLASVGLVGRGADGERHIVECVVRQSAASGRRPDRRAGLAHGGGQQLRRRDGQNDRRPEHRRRQRGDGVRSCEFIRCCRARDRQPGHRAAVRLFPQHRPGGLGGCAGPAASLRHSLDDPECGALESRKMRG